LRRKRKRHHDLPPFFDRVDNPELHRVPDDLPVDITPPPPSLKEFDRDLLKICGGLGKRVKPAAFQELLLRYPAVLDRIAAAVDGELFADRSSPNEFLADLTAIWFNRQGLEHVFCGEVCGRKIRGLHYFGRYLQLQSQGIGGRLPNNQHHEEVIPGLVYTIGVLLYHDGRLLSHPRKGYAIVADAENLLVTATKAFKEVGRGRTTCSYNVPVDTAAGSYSAVLVKEDDGIITFYPDVTPNNPQCTRLGIDD
jgi:hypothetical protein